MPFMRLAFVAAAALVLSSCVLSPGKFVSTLHIAKDRGFTFTYAGEVILLDPASAMQQGMQEGLAGMSEGGTSGEGNAAAPAAPAKPAAETAQAIAEGRAIAEALSKEAGYRSAEYLGKNRFRVDYSITGRLDRSFVYPVNLDAKSIIPWIAVEVRKDRTARIKAIAFGDPDEGMGSAARPDDQEKERDGTFTVTTDAELVMHNNEEGMAPGPGRKVVWRVTPASKTVPTAVVRFSS
ncbi:MAG TPA: hypothetical protein VK403_12850 [Allosphingosinicella sp.]|nr:hypothetical protein [Allosphingosinicella sp.]